MPNRFWRGGAGTWDATTTTNWSATSGGAGGASAPTSVDDVFFNSASNATAYTLTIATGATCRSLTMAGPASGNLTTTGTGALSIFGSMTLAATGVVRTHAGTIAFSSTSSGNTITTNGVGLSNEITFNGIGGSWSLGSALTNARAITVTNGTFNTANFNLSLTALLSTNSNTRSISLGSSTVTLSAARAIDFTTDTGLTFNAGTSTINCTVGTQLEFYAGSGQTFYNVNGTGTAGNTYTDIQGANTFNNLSLTGQTTGRRLTFNANTTINGTFTVTGGTNLGGMWSIRPADFTTNRTITAAAVSLTDVQFHNITAAGAASWTGTRLGDAGLNSNITFPAPKTVYWSLLTGGNINGNGWAASSGGSPAAANYPLCQDTGVIDDAGINAAATLTWNVTAQVFAGGLNFSALTKNITFSLGQSPNLGGCTWVFDSNVTAAGTGIINMYGGGSTVNCNGMTLTRQVNIQNGTNTLTGPFVSSNILALNRGTLVLGSNVTCTALSSSNTNTRQIQFGTNSINTTSTGAVFTVNGTNLTYTGTPTVNISNNSATGTSINTSTGFTETNSFDFNVTTGTYALSITANSFFKSLNFTGFTGSCAPVSARFYGNLTLVAGMTFTENTGVFTFANTSGVATLTSAGKTLGSITVAAPGATVAFSGTTTIGPTRTLLLSSGTLQLPASTTTTVGVFATEGTTLKFLTSSTPGAQATLSDSSGTNAVTYLSIQDSNATGGAVFDALDPTNVNAGNNTGWLFASAGGGNYFLLF